MGDADILNGGLELFLESRGSKKPFKPPEDREREEAGQGVARGDFYEPDGGVAYISLPTCPWPGPSLWAQLTARETGKCGLPVSKQNVKLVLVNSWPSQLYLLSYFIESMTSSVHFSSVKSLSHVRLFATP